MGNEEKVDYSLCVAGLIHVSYSIHNSMCSQNQKQSQRKNNIKWSCFWNKFRVLFMIHNDAENDTVRKAASVIPVAGVPVPANMCSSAYYAKYSIISCAYSLQKSNCQKEIRGSPLGIDGY